MCLQTGDANLRFFHIEANGRSRTYQISRLKAEDQEYVWSQEVGPHEPFLFLYQEGELEPIEVVWLRGKSGESRTVGSIGKIFLSEGSSRALGCNGLPVFFYSEFRKRVRPKVMATFEEFLQGMGGMERIIRSHLFFLPKC